MPILAEAHPVAALVLWIFLGAAAVMNLFTNRIDNQFALLLVGGGIVAAVIAGRTDELWLNAAIGVGMLVLTAILFAMKAMGGGAAKLLPASAFLIGWEALLPFVITTLIAGGVLAVVAILWHRMAGAKDNDARVPFGPAILAGALYAVLFQGGMG